MARSFPLLTVFSLTVSAVALCAATAQAQNYVQPENFSGPNVVIDFGALDQASAAPNQWAVAPVMQEPLMAPAPPPKLTPPPARQPMRMSPVSPAPVTTAQPPMVPDNAPLVADAPQHPSPPASMRERMASASMSATTPVRDTARPAMPPSALPAPTDFSARDMLNGAPPAPSQSNTTPSVAQAPVPSKPPAPVAQPSGFATKTMLAQARKNSSEKADRVNLASISDGPPLPLRNQAAAVSAPVTTAPKPAAAPPKPVLAKPAPLASNPSPAALPPAGTLDDLDTSDNAMSDVVKQARDLDKTPAKPEPVKPVQMASLPPSVAPLRDLDTEDRPASRAAQKTADADMPQKGEHASLHFAKDAGALDEAAKKDLDKIIKALKTNGSSRAQIRAYASGTPETSGQARRLSLTRALAARSYIVDQNIPATRLDIRALGNGQGGVEKPVTGDMDRVDITLVN